MRLTLLAVASETGLGYQTNAYYKHLKPNKVVIIDISNLNGQKQHYEWYEDAPQLQVIKGIPRDDELHSILEDTNVLLTAETVYNMNMYRVAKILGVKTICVENPEFYDHVKYPQYDMPDYIILPSVWKQEEITAHANHRGTKVVQIHHPVDLDEIKFVERHSYKFMHIAGNPAAHDRNGTWDFLQACPDGLVTTQNKVFANLIRKRYRQSRVLDNITDNKTLYELGDILVLPRKYGGNCLPLNEALASGMPVIMPDISPNNHLLPKEWLVKAYITGSFEPRTKVDIYTVDHDDLRNKIDWFRQQNIAEQSRRARSLAETISWEHLKDRYLEVIHAA